MRRSWPLFLVLDACVFRPPVSAEVNAQDADPDPPAKDAIAEDASVGDAVDADAEVNDAFEPDAAPAEAGSIDAACIAGDPCSDGDYCTTQDFCSTDVCIGHVMTGTCADSCDNRCDRGSRSCCVEQCGGQTACSACETGRSCLTNCEGDCAVTCRAGSACRFLQNQPMGSPSSTTLTCETGASCELTCDGHSESDYSCRLECAAGAKCLLSCLGGNEVNCNLNCSGGSLECGSNVFACGRECPM
jgi:hypothetical protein